jgi:signal transduction histidine kinase/CheY-like chemotaxis protein
MPDGSEGAVVESIASVRPTTAGRVKRAVHVSASPEESYLLGVQLEEQGLEFDITTVSDRRQFVASLEVPPSIVVADVPLPWPGADDELSELQRVRPDVPVVFRWGTAGSWSVEDSTSQLGRSVRAALSLGLESVQSPEERRRVLHEVVRYQSAHLQLGQLDTWDWEAALQRATEIMAETAHVERVGVWRLHANREQLECQTLFIRSQRRHVRGGEVPLAGAYRRAIEQATFIAAHDAQHDPRTSDFAADYLVPLGITSMLDAPIRRGGRVVGVVCFEHVGPPRQWNVVEQCAAAAFAGVVARIIEVGERRSIEEQWQESRRLEVIGRIAGGVAHDLGNLTTVITGYTEMLLSQSDDTGPAREALLAVDAAGRSATALVKQLLTYAARQAPVPRTVDLCETIRGLRMLIQRLLGSRIRLDTILPDGRLPVHIDATQVHRVVLNLAANSRDAMPEGGTFSVELDVVGPGDGAAAHERARLRVTDTGCGIPPEVLPHVFAPLYTTKAPGIGTGFGLASVHEIVTAAGGEVAVESRLGEFTRFTILLPLQATVDRAPVSEGPATAGLQHHSGVILLVDDDPGVANLLERTLRRHYTLTVARSPQEALERAAALGDRLAMVVSDYTMPGMSGIELLNRLRAATPTLAALLLTAEPDAPNILEWASAAGVQVMGKPFEISSLVTRVADVMQRGVAARSFGIEDAARGDIA